MSLVLVSGRTVLWRVALDRLIAMALRFVTLVQVCDSGGRRMEQRVGRSRIDSERGP